MSAAGMVSLFDAGPDDPAVLRAVLRLVMAGRYAQLDDGRIVRLSEEFTNATTDLAAGHADTLEHLVDSRRVRFGAPVGARVDGESLSAHLLIGPFDTAAGES